MGSRSSENDVLNIGQIFNVAKDYFIDLQETVDYIEMTDFESTETEAPLTLGQILSLEAK